MKYPINYKYISPKTEYYPEVMQIYEKASLYLKSFDWCKKIEGAFLYVNLGSKLCLFLFEINNSASTEDCCLWVIVGDLPSMYLGVQSGDTTREILTSYADLAEDWVQHIKSQEPLDDCYPFDAEATEEIADLLNRRVNILKNSVIDNIDDITVKSCR